MKKVQERSEAEIFLEMYFSKRRALAEEYAANVAMVRRRFWLIREKKVAVFAYECHARRLNAEYADKVACLDRENKEQLKLYYHGVNC